MVANSSGGLEVGGDLLGQLVGLGEAVGVFQALVLDPEDVEVELVPLRKFLIGEASPAAIGAGLAPSRLALRTGITSDGPVGGR